MKKYHVYSSEIPEQFCALARQSCLSVSAKFRLGVDTGPDETNWYRLLDELNEVKYHARANHLRLIQTDEFEPISPQVNPSDKRWHR